ncbi:MAG: endonuclease III [Bacteroidetes bacterium]|nr:endonuclease III [Bacteroidota bacterium]
MTRKERVTQVLERLAALNPSPETELHYTTPFELLVAVMLSAQCTDKRVNMVTPALFERLPDARTMAAAPEEEIFALIRSISYPNSKAQHLKATAQALQDSYGGEVPRTMEELIRLPGVGRKTANVIMGVLFDGQTMPVDTHVFRVSNRLGIARATNVRQTEEQLLRIIPGRLMHDAHHWLILHGRYICKARTPLCGQCALTDLCQWYQKTQPRPASA